MQTPAFKLFTFGILVILALLYAVLMLQGIQDYAQQAFTPEQMLNGKAPAHIPVWIEGSLEKLPNTPNQQPNSSYFQLTRDGKSLFVLAENNLLGTWDTGAQIAVLGRKPHDCLPDKIDCPLEARALLPAGSWLKFLNMGGYGFFVWVSYGLAGLILLVNFIQPKLREREIKRALARKERRRNL